MATPAPSPSASPSSGPVPAPTTSPSPPANGSSSSPSNAPTPQPSPGSLTDPNGKDISRSDKNSERKQRADELAAMKPAPPGNAVGFDLQPQHVYYASYTLRNAHYDFMDRVESLVTTLALYPHAVGCGSGPEAFAKAYAEVADLFLRVWCRAAEGVGGAAVGLTITANHYAQADQATHPLVPAVVKKNPPDVLKNPNAGGPVADLAWGNAQGADSWGDKMIDEVAAALSWVGDHVLRPVLRDALRHGKVADITPGGDDIDLPKIAERWRIAATDAMKSAQSFDDALAYITNPAVGNDEWQKAMKQFCSAIWGTTAWGAERHGRKWNHRDGQQPALDILQDTARGIAAACEGVCAEVKKVRSTIADVYKDAALKTFSVKSLGDAVDLLTSLGDLALEFISNIDTMRLDQAVDSYNREISSLARDLDKFKPALDEAELSLPRYAAEEARAEAFGARALNGFRSDRPWVKQEEIKNGTYKISLASDEWLGGGHTLDKHVGKTDEQLAQRLRDQGDPPTPAWPHGKPKIGAASTFFTAEQAQRLTQYNVDVNADEIKKWLGRPPKAENGDLKLPISCTAPNGEVSGHSVTKQPNPVNNEGFKHEGLKAGAIPVNDVKTVLKYDPSLNPPFVVLTSMPEQ